MSKVEIKAIEPFVFTADHIAQLCAGTHYTPIKLVSKAELLKLYPKAPRRP